MALRSNGTHLFFIDAVTDPLSPVLQKLNCPTGIDGIDGGQRNKIDSTCLSDTTDEKQITGLATPADMSAPYNFDPNKLSHQTLPLLKASGQLIKWIICFSDGDEEPTVEDGEILAPTGRTSWKCTAEVSENAISVQNKDLVKGTLTLARSGSGQWKFKNKGVA